MPDTITHGLHADSPRISLVVREAADRAFRSRVAAAIARVTGEHAEVLRLRREQFTIADDRWDALSSSSRNATSPAEFRRFAKALFVDSRWLAIGSGPMEDMAAEGWTPPTGWFTFGSHVDQADVDVEFSDALDPSDGLPRYERPRIEVAA